MALLGASAGACADDSAPEPGEVVVEAAGTDGSAVALLGAAPGALYWTTGGPDDRAAMSTSLDTLPASPDTLGAVTGPAAYLGDHVLYVSAESAIVRAKLGQPSQRLVRVSSVDAIGETQDGDAVWTTGGTVSWGQPQPRGTVSVGKVAQFTGVLATASAIYASSDAKLVRIDRAAMADTTLTTTAKMSMLFPGGPADGATYAGKLVGADATGALWLVTEAPSGRAILVGVPDQGSPSVLLPHMQKPTAVFVTAGALYWQESDALLTAPRTGGPASIAAHVPNAGAIADGFVYYVDGNAILRAPLD